jgi:hypothetical protein
MALLRMNETGSQLEIWGQQRGQQNIAGTSEWICTRTIELKQPAIIQESDKRELYLLGGKSGTLFVTDSRKCVYTADIETGTIEEVVQWPRTACVVPEVSVPLEMYWPTIFLSQIRHFLG